MAVGAEAVYQPTTVSVSYQPRPGGMHNRQRSAFIRMLKTPKYQRFLLIFGLITIPLGLVIVGSAALTMPNDGWDRKQTDDPLDAEFKSFMHLQLPMFIIFIGSLLMASGLFTLGVFVTVADLRSHCICQCPLFDKKNSLARQLQGQNCSGRGEGIIALNPSTDLLVSHTQYVPVSSELPHQGDEEERRNLMPDNKDCLSSAEESDRMLEPDPRIVLRPMGRVEDA